MKSIRKIFVALTFLLSSSMGYVYADPNDSLVWGECENCFSCQPNCGIGFIGAEVLYWRPFERGLDTCVPSEFSETVNSDGFVTSRFRGKDHDPKFRWNPGFRIGAGYQFACSKLFVADTWTHFHSNNNHSKHHGNRVRWKIKFDVLDIVGGYNFDYLSCFAVRPFAGLRAVNIDQKIRNGDFPSPLVFSNTTDVFFISKNKQDFWGIGPLLGLEADWNLGRGFGLYANASLSWLYGNVRIKLIESEQGIDFIDFWKVTKHLDDILTAADVGFGVRWETCFCANTRFVLKFGLEHHQYFDYNHLGCCGDLSFDGVNLSAGFEF